MDLRNWSMLRGVTTSVRHTADIESESDQIRECRLGQVLGE